MKKYWQGNESLAKTLWLFWVTGSLIFSISCAALVYVAGLVFQFPSTQLAFITFLLLLLFNPYYIACWVATWRSTKNTAYIAAKIGVKLLVAAHVTYVIYSSIGINKLIQNGI